MSNYAKTPGKRRDRRWEKTFDISFASLDDDGRRSLPGSARDVSAGGIRFLTNRYLRIGDEVEIEFSAQELSTPMRAMGRVQRVERRGGNFEVGVKFTSESVREELVRVLAPYLRVSDEN